MIKVKNISKQYGTVQALKDINLEIEKGSCFGLVGPNGAGKSTLMKVLSGILLHFEGDISINEYILSQHRLEIKKEIGYVPQEICLEETLSARENLQFFGRLYGLKGNKLKQRMDEVLEQIGLTDRCKDKVVTYSGGMKRRLNIGCALLHEPAIIVMDEPTVGIDPQSRNSIFSLIQQLKNDGSTIVYSSHYMEEVEKLCDSVGLIDKGKLIQCGKMKEVVQVNENPALFVAGDNITFKLLSPYGEVIGKGNGFLLHSDNPLWALEQLAGRLRAKGIEVQRLEFYQPKLEDVFFHLTGTQLRDV